MFEILKNPYCCLSRHKASSYAGGTYCACSYAVCIQFNAAGCLCRLRAQHRMLFLVRAVADPGRFYNNFGPPIPRRLLFCALYMYLCFLKIFSAALFSSRVFIVTKLWCLLPNLELKIVRQMWFDSNK